MPIIRYTTPTIKFTFSEIDVSRIVTAYLVIKQNGRTVIERDLSSAGVDEGQISWSLAQVETGKLSKTNATIYCDWLLRDGTRGRSNLKTEAVEDSGKSEVI